jgi:hypothetical protein
MNRLMGRWKRVIKVLGVDTEIEEVAISKLLKRFLIINGKE